MRIQDTNSDVVEERVPSDEATMRVTSGPQRIGDVCSFFARAADARARGGAAPLMLLAAAMLLAGCAGHAPRRLQTTSIGAPVRMAGDFSGIVTLDGGVVTVQLERARVRYNGWAAGDSASVEGVTLRAIVAADSAGVGIPLGVSGSLDVAPLMEVGSERSLDGAAMAIPIPPDRRARDLWIAFQFRGTVRARSSAPELLIAYTCSEMNLFGVSKSANARARRIRASYAVGCSL